MMYWVIITVLVLLLLRKAAVKMAKKAIKNHEFKKWKNEVKRHLYEAGHDAETIALVDTKEDYWLMLYVDEVPAELAIIIAGLEAGETEEEVVGI